MPTIIVPSCFLEPEDYSSREVEVWFEKCLVRELRAELLGKFPQLAMRYPNGNTDWFRLVTDDGDLEDATTISPNDRVYLINMIGC